VGDDAVRPDATPRDDGPLKGWPIVGHRPVLLGLWRAAKAERLPHALLFQGRSGIGKFRAALALAQGLFCARGIPGEEGPCGVCGPCKRFVSGNHADVLVIDPQAEEGELIKIDRIVRRPDGWEWPADEFLALKPMEGGWRVALVREAERMNEESQNALLKMLEEPGRAVLWILETARPERLRPTIRSRCIQVRLESLAAEDVRAVLAQRGFVSGEAAIAARWSQGSPGGAMRLLEQGALRIRPHLLEVLRGREDPLEAVRALGELDGEFRGKTASAQMRARARAVLDLGLAVLRDLGRLAAGAGPALLAHGDLESQAAEFPAFRSPALLRWQMEVALSCRGDLDLNLDAQAALERALLAFAARDLRHLRRGAWPVESPTAT
jgi:DNA polymerase III subunit delta'